MTLLETWCFACITCTFGALLSYVVILLKMEIAKRRKVVEMKTFSNFQGQNESPRDYVTELQLFGATFSGFVVFNFIFWFIL